MHDVKALLREYDRARAYTDELWRDLSPGEVTWRPHENIGWHLGHPLPADPEPYRVQRIDGYLVLRHRKTTGRGAL
jgi:hypothetical protein